MSSPAPDLQALQGAATLPGAPDLRGLTHPTLGGWLLFRKTLTPRYATVWLDIDLAIALMLAGAATHLVLTIRWGAVVGFAWSLPFAIWIGFWMNALITFGHEAAHYNLAADRTRNDRLADWSIWLFFPQTTKAYRKSHWQHHLHLGDQLDTETSYHSCVSPWFLATLVTGIYPVSRFLAASGQRSGAAATAARAAAASAIGAVPLARALATHGVIVSIALWFHAYATVLTWLAGTALVFPSLAAIRQILEHRALEADCDIDFRIEPHGAVNRMFGTTVLARYYGAAGFNRHMLHHWDPTVSYTRFDDMEQYFLGTPLAAGLGRARSTYWSSLRLLLRKGMLDH